MRTMLLARRARRVGQWLVPLAVLGVVALRVDVAGAWHALRAGYLPWLLVGLACYPTMMLVGAWRWRALVNADSRESVPFAFLLEHYWIGVAVGVLAPGSIGWDVYRAVSVSRRYGRPAAQVSTLVYEKAAALAGAAVLAVAFYPAASHLARATIPSAGTVFRLAAVLGLACLAAFGAAVALRSTLSRRSIDWATARVRVLLRRVECVLDPRKAAARGGDDAASISRLGPAPLLAALVLSLAIQVLAALCNQVLFVAVGSPVPLAVHLFLTPIFFLALWLPISLGGLGVREGLFIVCYGWFGVRPEVALAVALANLGGKLLNYGIGVLTMVARNVTVDTVRLGEADDPSATGAVGESRGEA